MSMLMKIDTRRSRGWRGRVYIKRATAKATRQAVRAMLRDEAFDETCVPTKATHVTSGWTS